MEVTFLHLKVLLVAFLCFLSISMICSVSTSIMKAIGRSSSKGSLLPESIVYDLNNGTNPDGGDPRGGGWPN
jgi:hypothetical protein